MPVPCRIRGDPIGENSGKAEVNRGSEGWILIRASGYTNDKRSASFWLKRNSSCELKVREKALEIPSPFPLCGVRAEALDISTGEIERHNVG